MRRFWTLRPGGGFETLQLNGSAERDLGPGDVRVSLRANSLNSRDAMAAMGQSPLPLPEEIVPVSDGAGVVTEIGEAVTAFAIGDRVVIAFNPLHQDGPFRDSMASGALGELRPGVLASEVVLEESALVHLPDSVSFEQAACLPCVAVTAWNALFELGPLLPGQTVVAVGTGMVALTAVGLAKAAGARVGITSSDDRKLERVRALGADFTVNYRERSDWSTAVRELTGGQGADVILETAGPPSIAQSIKACGQGGRVMQIGFKAAEGPPIEVIDLLMNGARLLPVMVGSRAVLERVVAATAFHDLRVPINERFAFDEAPSAFAAFMSPKSFGKTLILHDHEETVQ